MVIKRLFVFLFLCFLSNTYAQQTIFIVDDETGKQQNYAWVKLLRNGYEPITKEFKWEPNYLENLKEGIEIKETDSLFLGLYNPQYLPIWKNIDINSTDTLFIHLVKDRSLPSDIYSYVDEYSVFPYSSNFYPRVIQSFEDLPIEDILNIQDYLEYYVGEELYKELKLFRIYSMNSDQMDEVDFRNNFRPNEIVYHLIFSFEKPSLQIGWYTTSLQVSSSGRKYKLPDLPNDSFAKQLNQASIPALSKAQIYEILAKKPRFDPEITTIEFTFSRRAKVFVWVAKESRIGPHGITYVTESHYDAVSGVLLANFLDRLNIIYD